jgi:hypothetical protein
MQKLHVKSPITNETFANCSYVFILCIFRGAEYSRVKSMNCSTEDVRSLSGEKIREFFNPHFWKKGGRGGQGYIFQAPEGIFVSGVSLSA